MTNGNRKDFLNNGILGGGAGVAEKKGFRAVRTEYITSPDYDPKYFETFPTSWAAAYAFRKTLDLPATVMSGVDGGRFTEEVSQAVEEWATLFLLHYFGILFLTESKQIELQQHYDKDLWLALSGTYPSAREQPPRSIKLLQHGETVVGAFYPSVIFFPARDRTRWLKDKTLADYILDGRLSWTRSRRILLSSEKEERDFHAHLRAVAAQRAISRGLRDRLYDFCEAHFQGRVDAIPELNADPANWDVPGLKQWDSEELLEMYPLRKPNRPDGDEENPGRIFYLVNGLPEYTPWMKSAILPSGPAPYQYRKVTDRQIAVELPGRKFLCDLRNEDTIVSLKDLFLNDPPHWCKMPKASDSHAAHIRTVHKVELRDPVVTEKDIAICLAPVTSDLLAHFPELLRDTDRISVSPNVEGSSVEWTIPIMGREVRWQTRPSYAKGLTTSSLALWPPRVSSEWRLYAAYGVGPREDSGRWHLVDQNGKRGKLIEVEEEEYVSVLYGSALPNQPRAMVLFDSGDRERGVLFFADFGGDQTPNRDLDAKLAVDFGTSNTSLAYSLGNSQPETLRFQLTPRPIWGMRRDLQHREQPGFFPYEWSATTTKGFYPTILLSRRNDSRLTDELEPENVALDHLFKVDIPGLHRDLEQRLYEGSLNATWKPHSNLKWDLDGRTEPWRTLFLELTLLYAHADLFFDKRALVDHYVFTFPLAFRKDDRENYHTKVKTALKQIRYYCYGASLMANVNYDDQIDESTAIAESVGAVGIKATMELFIDVGGGTCDIAVSHDRKFLVLDSIRVAGNTFFQFAKKSFNSDLKGAVQFKKHLGKLLQGANDSELKVTNSDPSFGLDIVYSVGISGLPDQQFKEREAAILRKGMGTYSYQRYRTRLFFRHIITYSLLQACAAAVDHKIKLSSGINLILGGNGWGLMMFAEFARDSSRLREEAATILKTLKQDLGAQAIEEERQYLEPLKISNLILLNEDNLSKAKTNVALGALVADSGRRNGDRSTTMPYTGVTLEELSLSTAGDPKTIRWCERWGIGSFKDKFPGVEQVEDGSFTVPDDLERPFNPVLQAFTAVGNVRGQDKDNMPAEAWTNINGRLAEFVSMLRGNVERLEVSPINHFLSEVLYSKKASRDYLDTLAEVNGNYRAGVRED